MIRLLLKPLLDRIAEVEENWAMAEAEIVERKGWYDDLKAEAQKKGRDLTDALRQQGRLQRIQGDLRTTNRMQADRIAQLETTVIKTREACGFFFDVAKSAIDRLPPEYVEEMVTDIEFYKIKAKEQGFNI